jgi:hypothetical protein
MAGGLGVAAALYWAWADDWTTIDDAKATLLASGAASADLEWFQSRLWACSSAKTIAIDGGPTRSMETQKADVSSAPETGPVDRGPSGSIETHEPDASSARDRSHPWNVAGHVARLANAVSPRQFSRSSARVAGIGRIPRSPDPSSRTHDSLRLAAFAQHAPAAS